ncbi:hypothetical protein [Chryseobacterium polytrichastri]|uniref:Uncharacterized protein n=1 Tax=Chryseobacterium polytrichastri TaxID=1302687 RepID=A0A1M6R002_9FLAO|nr:hypothetical protein [Chryseobacterium polytrichastri]SHK25753.1 hypothetical protein SAMN05444267_1002142 [Chryseobacterium polytrichastri]
MKIILIISFLLPSLLFSQKTVSADYKKIPEILDNTDLLYPFIKPDKKYQYWSVLRNIEDPDPDKSIIYESQMPDFMTLNDPVPEKGFFQQCTTSDCFSYILACKNNKTEYFNNEQQLRDFIGSVDNLPEALLIAKTYGFTFDSTNPLGGSYKTDDQYISMYISKQKNATQKESFLVKVNKKTGKLEAKSNGIY